MNKQELGEVLADNWLRMQKPFGHNLCDTGERYNGNPVFMLTARFAVRGDASVKVYRYTPINSEYSVLAFVPEKEKAK